MQNNYPAVSANPVRGKPLPLCPHCVPSDAIPHWNHRLLLTWVATLDQRSSRPLFAAQNQQKKLQFIHQCRC